MGYWDDYAAAVQFYPEMSVRLELVNFYYEGDDLNQGEGGFFKIQITNEGPLSRRDVRFKVRGLNGMKVKDPDAGHVEYRPVNARLALRSHHQPHHRAARAARPPAGRVLRKGSREADSRPACRRHGDPCRGG
jgi:hypothetical protein